MASSNAWPSMFDRNSDRQPVRTPCQRVDQQRGTEDRAANADVEDSGNVPERSGLDRIDERSGALVPGCGEVDVLGSAAAAFGDVVAARPSLGLTTSPENKAWRAAAKPMRSARSANSASRASSRWVFDQSK